MSYSGSAFLMTASTVNIRLFAAAESSLETKTSLRGNSFEL